MAPGAQNAGDGGSTRDGGQTSDGGPADGGVSDGGGGDGSAGTTTPCSETAQAPAGGSISIDAAFGLVGLCNGWIVIGDHDKNQLVRRNVVTGEIHSIAQLDSQPKAMVLDVANDLVYTALNGNGIAKLDLGSLSLHLIGGANADDIALGNDGQVLGIAVGQSYVAQLFVFDGRGESLLTSMSLSYPFSGGLIAYDRARDQLIAGGVGVDPGGLARFAFDPVALTATLQQHVDDIGDNCKQLSLSPDGTHTALACGGGNTNLGYNIADYRSDDFTLFDGDFVVGAYPTGAVFSPDGRYFAASDTQNLKIYDATTKSLVKTVARQGSCVYGQAGYVTFSVGSSFAFMLTPSCNADGITGPGILTWTTVP